MPIYRRRHLPLRLRKIDSRGQVALGASVANVRRGLAAFKIERRARLKEIVERAVATFARH